jgi:hypothetical protein
VLAVVLTRQLVAERGAGPRVSFGNFVSAGQKSRSASAMNELTGVSTIDTSTGASRLVYGTTDDDPMCRQTTVPSSSHAAQNGSQLSLCRLGKPSFSGFSENVIA